MVIALLHLIWVFGRLSLLAVGGGLAILPEMQRLTVAQYHWVTNAQFRDSLGQVTPGPGMLMSAAIGYKAGGIPGAAVAAVSMLLPTCVLTSIVGRNWDRFSASRWRIALQQGLGPVVIGLMAAGAYALARTAILGPVTAAVAAGVTLILLRAKLSPALLVIAGAVVGFFFLR